MVRSSSLVALLLAAGCFAEPNIASSNTSDGTSSQGTTTSEIGVSGTSVSSSASSSSNPGSSGEGASSGSTDACPEGSVGCPCQDRSCEGVAECIEGICEMTGAGGCGDGIEAGAEECDDGNNEPGDGCSPICRFERECFYAHLGGPGKTSSVLSYSVFRNGTMELTAEHGVPEHNPPPSGPGSRLSEAAVSCGGQVYVASSTAGMITALRPGIDVINQVEQASAPGVRELACDADAGLLFAVRFVPDGFAISTFDISAGTLVSGETVEYTEAAIPQMNAARLSLDRASERFLVSFVAEAGAATPLSLIQGGYGSGGLSLGTPAMLPAVRDELGALLHIGPSDELLGIGAGLANGRGLYRLPLTTNGFDPIDVLPGLPWEELHNVWPFRIPGGELGLAMGGTQGVFVVPDSPGGKTKLTPDAVATALPNTFARTAFDDTILIVASPQGFETYDLTMRGGGPPWPLLSEFEESSPGTFSSGAVVPCP